MRKTLMTIAIAATIAAGTVATPTRVEARCLGCWAGAGLAAGLIGGAIIANSYRGYGGYGYGPAYYGGYGGGYAPAYYYPQPVYYYYPQPVYYGSANYGYAPGPFVRPYYARRYVGYRPAYRYAARRVYAAPRYHARRYR